MQQQEAESELQENTQPDNLVNTSDEVNAESSPPIEDEKNGINDAELELSASTTESELEIEKAENSNNEDTASDSPPTRTKTLRKSSKKKNAKKEKFLEPVELKLQTELKHDSDIVITEINEEDVAITTEIIEVTETLEEDVHVVVDEPEETNILDTSDESGHVEYNELPEEEEEEEKSEGSLEAIVEEEMSMTASVSYEELSQPESRHSDGSEKCSFSITSTEYDEFKSRFNGKEKSYEEPLCSNYISVSGGSLGGNIRSVSARRPMQRSCSVTRQRSPANADRPATDGNNSDTDGSIEAREGSTFSSLKRKAFDNVSIDLKKRKINDSMNSKFFSMVSSPLRLLRNKLSDRIVEGPNAHRAEDITNGNDDDNESIDEKIKEETSEIKEKTHNQMTNKINHQNTSLYQSWCNLM